MNVLDTIHIPSPDSLAVGRTQSAFAADLEHSLDALDDAIRGKRLLVIGGAGSIGSNTIATISYFKPAALHVCDHNENGLAELVRTLRSRPAGLDIADFRTLPINYGNRAFDYFLNENSPYDHVLNFAALKHVRSEKDHYSILEMLRTNLLLMSDLMEKLCAFDAPSRFFSVSTDKAANPSSVMGASKRLMEHFLFDRSLPRPDTMEITSARFANVAYSNGSLLQSFQNRLAQRQPLVAPKDCRRYFVSLQESGHICTLAAFVAPADTIAIPNLDPEKSLVLLETVLYGFLESDGLEPVVYADEAEARRSVDACHARHQWPVVLTPLDTAGEKPYEEFVGEGEEVIDLGLAALSGVRYRASSHGSIVDVKDSLERVLSTAGDGPAVDKNYFRDLIASVEPAFLATHRDAAQGLDQRM